ncbi:DUF2922 domain-containing protein [Desulfosporosinus nitroreducens]|uniref:DUF2922 domain-containing protein n=1 Tax=Desulfosporosinus nitroreducens TaxID=2018668 RepID=A0ABT8QWG8_9FIRM|nr:DUF2922 domain-containing protein [Desulfosporosinus nitroreducens]MCO1600949.1 DUF2922 domain-containing protein [Desulfosporosinus nitroreducens]MDO0825684.1 DUF2922 domain-containing protein [Desulfosporosinus nitroreducens]
MAITTKKVLRMTFTNAAGKTVTMTLDQPKEGITSAEIETVMDQIISKDIFFTSGGGLVSKRDIKIVDTKTEDMYEQPEG